MNIWTDNFYPDLFVVKKRTGRPRITEETLKENLKRTKHISYLRHEKERKLKLSKLRTIENTFSRLREYMDQDNELRNKVLKMMNTIKN